ncbi:MAG TPA: hypothetical protein VF342_08000 [Alphaproteobacteria bacterium]
MIDTDLFLRFVVALALVLALIAGMAWIGRLYMTGGSRMGLGAKRRRLGIIEALPLDGRARLVLVRRDEVEHLVMLGPNGATVVERDIRHQGEFSRNLMSLTESGK